MCSTPGWLRPNSPNLSPSVATAAATTPSKTSADVQADAENARQALRLSRRGFIANLTTSGFGDTSQADVKGVTLGV